MTFNKLVHILHKFLKNDHCMNSEWLLFYKLEFCFVLFCFFCSFCFFFKKNGFNKSRFFNFFFKSIFQDFICIFNLGIRHYDNHKLVLLIRQFFMYISTASTAFWGFMGFSFFILYLML